jgi:putative DNA primase/helicase
MPDAAGFTISEPKPLIRISPGKIDMLTDEAEEALITAKADVFQRAEHLVRPGFHDVIAANGRTTIAAGLHVLKQPALVEELARVADFQIQDRRAKGWRRIDPPASIAATLSARVGRWRLRSVAAITTCPTLRPDGSILSAAGYDEATRIYHMPEPSLRMPPIPAHPTRDNARVAVNRLVDLLSGFPFVGNADKAVALSLIVSAVVRGALGMVPVHAFTAPTPGTGKSYVSIVLPDSGPRGKSFGGVAIDQTK